LVIKMTSERMKKLMASIRKEFKGIPMSEKTMREMAEGVIEKNDRRLKR